MSQVATLLASSLARALVLTGEALTYATAAGVETAVARGQFSETDPAAARRRDGAATQRTATAIVAASDVAAPEPGDTITRGAEVWAVVTAQPIAGRAYWRLALRLADLRERSRGEYRIDR